MISPERRKRIAATGAEETVLKMEVLAGLGEQGGIEMSNPFAWLMKRIMWPGLLTLDAVFAKAKERGFQLAIFPDANHIHPWRAEIIRPARRVECDQRWWLLHRIDKEANGPTPLHAALSALCAIEHEVAKRDPISSKVPA